MASAAFMAAIASALARGIDLEHCGCFSVTGARLPARSAAWPVTSGDSGRRCSVGLMADFAHERRLGGRVAGVDEAGRGPLAGLALGVAGCTVGPDYKRPAPADPNHAHADYSVAEFRALLEGAGWHVEAHAVCCHALLRLVMVYWRHPLIRAGGTGNPYLPRFVLHGLAHLDRRVRLGRPWDLVVRATKR